MDDPRDLDMTPDQGQESPDHAPSGGWYRDEEEPHAWTGDAEGSDLLPGLDPEQGSRGGTGGGSGGKSRKKKGRRRVRIILLAILTVFVLLIVAAGGVGYHYYKTYIDPPDFSGPGTTGTVVVQIKPGQFADQIGLTLASDGVVASARAFSNAAKASPQGNALEPGYYRVHKHMKASLALALLLKPSSREQTKVTVMEGARVAQIIALLGQKTGNLKGYEQAIAHPAALGLPAFAHGKPEGYLFPATYAVQPNTPPAAVLKGMVNQFKANAQAIELPGRLGEGHMNRRLPSSRWPASSRPRAGRRTSAEIAEVIYNRLNMHMKLQLDTTVLYAMSLAHKSVFSTSFPSPYNTYLHAGLPPGPIDNPGNTAIQAALHPQHGNLLYFLTINSKTGKTMFFTNAADFDAAVAKYGSRAAGTGSHTGSG